MAAVLKRLGLRLRKVVQATPHKKIKETEAIVDNRKKDAQAVSWEGVKRWSIACKATVKLGEFSRGGLTRGDTRASAHALGGQEKYVPCGIVDEGSGEWAIPCGSSSKTSAGIVETIEAKWQTMDEQAKAETSLLQINMDNGPESSGRRTPCRHRMGQLADDINKPMPLRYYPPSQSKYHPIERCWGILEL
jgi:Rhodopirellula transposase DDE domain